MIYRSNLRAPDLTPKFRHLDVRPMSHSLGHSVPSDWADKRDDDPVFGLYKRCGLWTHDEAAILWHIASRADGPWVDIGAHTGWTSSYIQHGAGGTCVAIDPMLGLPEFRQRFLDNTKGMEFSISQLPSNDWFREECPEKSWFTGVCIDGDHEPGKPLEDAMNADRHLWESGVIVFHDFIGRPVRDAVTWLMSRGYKARIYWTPHVLACCWMDDDYFAPPDHIPDQSIMALDLQARMAEFNFGACV